MSLPKNLYRSFRDQVEENPGLTLTDYLRRLGQPEGSPLRTEAMRNQARSEINTELKSSLADLVPKIWWEEDEARPGQPRPKPPHWARDVIAAERIKLPITEKPDQPTDGLCAVHIAAINDLAKFDLRPSGMLILQKLVRTLGISHEELVTNLLSEFSIIASRLDSQIKLTASLERNETLYVEKLDDRDKLHQLKLELLADGRAHANAEVATSRTTNGGGYRPSRQ
jgi:hypothetical protein